MKIEKIAPDNDYNEYECAGEYYTLGHVDVAEFIEALKEQHNVDIFYPEVIRYTYGRKYFSANCVDLDFDGWVITFQDSNKDKPDAFEATWLELSYPQLPMPEPTKYWSYTEPGEVIELDGGGILGYLQLGWVDKDKFLEYVFDEHIVFDLKGRTVNHTWSCLRQVDPEDIDTDVYGHFEVITPCKPTERGAFQVTWLDVDGLI